MMNEQVLSIKKPEMNEKEIILDLYCVNCNASKTFKITEALKNMLLRNSNYIAYKSKCEKCGKVVGVKISWDF